MTSSNIFRWTILFVIGMPLTSFAAKCISSDIRQEVAEIRSLDAPDEAKEQFIQELKNKKTKQIIACASRKLEISKDDSVFAIDQIETQRKVQINAIENQKVFNSGNLDKGTMSTAAQYLYGSMVDDSAARIKEINTWVDAVVAQITRFTRY